MHEHKDRIIVGGVIIVVILALVGLTFWSLSRSKNQSSEILQSLDSKQAEEKKTKE